MSKFFKLSYLFPLVLLAGCDDGEYDTADEGAFEVEDRVLGHWYWHGPVSEEKAPLTCKPGYVVTAAKCEGSYCDDMTIVCADRGGGDSFADRFWTGWQSSSKAGDLCEYYGAAMSGIACRGSYCDELSIECTRTEQWVYDCAWTEEVHTDGDDSFWVEPDEVIAGILCMGNTSHCDDRKYRVCKIS